jgi:polyisoprenoid-binding protein YceI
MITDLAYYPRALTGTWTVDPAASHVTLTVGYALLGSIRARFTDVQGALFLDPDIRRSCALLLIDAGSVHTGRRAQDQWLRSAAFLDADAHSHLLLHSTELIPQIGGGHERALVTGELAIRDVARPIRVTVDLRSLSTDGSTARAKLAGHFTLSRAQYELGTAHDARRGSSLLDDDITVELDICAVRERTPTHHNTYGENS